MASRLYSASFLDLALDCGAELTGTPNGLEPITVVFSIEAWRKFDLATVPHPPDTEKES